MRISEMANRPKGTRDRYGYSNGNARSVELLIMSSSCQEWKGERVEPHAQEFSYNFLK